jgi:quinol-cytochrome oxidoreductase complex cytochrome b subunit
MSFWGAKVITNLFSVFDDLLGTDGAIVRALWGGFSVDNPTLNRFFSLHFLLPFVLAGVVILHIWALHIPGSTNPLGIDAKSPQDKLPFHPYYSAKDLFGLGVFIMIFGVFVFYMPNILGHPDNYKMANPMVTPAHIVPEWYYLPFYAILRSIENKLFGVLAMFASILILFVLPWLDVSKVRSLRFRPVARFFFWIFVINACFLGWLGQANLEMEVFMGLTVFTCGQISTAYYFGYFLVILPWVSRKEKPLPLPTSIAQYVLDKNAPKEEV